ncbi:MAG: glycosyltransferase family 2 protein [Chloroflexi bacterium]|nr:glycosyltransferase family 2 protein [Chloroflexota bacterium]
MPSDSEDIELSIVVPAYHEGQGIRDALLRLRDYLETYRGPRSWEVIVVDDGSGDDTSAAAAGATQGDPRFRVIRHEVNRGKGCAVKTGMLAARGRYAGFMDADLSTDLSAVVGALSHLGQGADVVIASRRVRGAHILVPQPWYRRLVSRNFRLAANSLVGLKGVRDSQCGFKFFRSAVAQKLFPLLTTDGFLFDVELLGLAQHFGHSVVEMPVTWTNRRQSKLRLWPLAYQVLRDLLRIRRRLASL